MPAAADFGLAPDIGDIAQPLADVPLDQSEKYGRITGYILLTIHIQNFMKLN